MGPGYTFEELRESFFIQMSKGTSDNPHDIVGFLYFYIYMVVEVEFIVN